MECPQVLCFWVLVFGFQLLLCGGFGCFEKEKSALLELKLSINHPNGTSLPSWREGTDCCSWKGVTCNSRTGRVIELDLSQGRKTDLGDWYLNASLLLPFEKLQSLVLNSNSLRGFIDGEAFKRWSKLSKLEQLFLYSNDLNETILPYLGAMESLKVLQLRYNKLYHSLAIEGLCKLKNLRELDLSRNEFDGTIPPCLGNLSNLQLLDLSQNQFTGRIPTSLIASLTSLFYFSVANNNFSGSLMLGSFAHLSKLKGFDLSNNYLEVETEYTPWNSTLQLRFIGLSNCKLNKRTGVIPNFFYEQHDLTEVDLSHNHLSGKFPIWLLENNTRLEVLNLRNNSLWGTFQHLYSNNTALSALDISNNQMSGQLPSDIGRLLPKLASLNLSRNFFQGSIPSSAGNLTRLMSLDLSHNNLSGEIQEHVVASWAVLLILKLSHNNLQGRIFSTYFNKTYLMFLYLDNNHFAGTMPSSFSNASFLQTLNIEGNHMSGRVPSTIENLSSLNILILRRNHFDGGVSFELGNLRKLIFLDLSENNLSGPIPSCFDSTNLKYIHLEENAFSGPIPSAPSRGSSIMSLNLRDNNIVGVLPTWIGRHSALRILILKGNNLHGHIPIELCQLKDLSLLDLSYNNLSGPLPSCINNLTFGRLRFQDRAIKLDSGGASLSTHIGISPNESDQMMKNTLNLLDLTLLSREIFLVKFITKNIINSYQGYNLNYMSGVDFSCNHLTGEIPFEMGQLSELRSLNLSYNQLIGSIPVTFKNLRQIESLDLSHNRLNGTIPSQLTELPFIAVFSVAYNNLSGRTPEMKSQFATFHERSYEGNPLLCGLQLNKSCISTTRTIQAPEKEEDDDNLVSFYASCVGSYLVFLFGTVVVLYFTSQKHAVCFFHVVDSWFAFRFYKLCTFFSCK